MTQLTTRRSRIFLLLLCLALPLKVYAFGDWQAEREHGVRLELAKNFAEALPHYQKALAALPAGNENLAVQLNCQVANCYVHQEQRLKALPYIDVLLSKAVALRASKTLTADSEVYLVALIEECEANHSSLATKSRKEWLQYSMLGERICEEAMPYLMTPDRQAFRSRCILAVSDRQSALDFLSNYMKKLSPKDPSYLRMQLKEAALKNSLHQPEMLRALSLRLSKSRPEAEAACLIGEAQLWAADYDAADATLKTAYDKLSKSNLSKGDRLNLVLLRFENSLDRGAWPQAEQFARQYLALNPPEKSRNRCLTGLSVCLAHQGKNKEAEEVKARKRVTTYSFLEEDERQAAAETQKRRAEK